MPSAKVMPVRSRAGFFRPRSGDVFRPDLARSAHAASRKVLSVFERRGMEVVAYESGGVRGESYLSVFETWAKRTGAECAR